MVYTLEYVLSDDCGEQPYLMIEAATESRDGYITIEFEIDDAPFGGGVSGNLNIRDVDNVLTFIQAEQTRQGVDSLASIFGEDHNQALTFEV